MAEKVPKTIALGLTKRAADGRIISINHPNPTGKVRNKRQYRSLKNDRIMLLPQNYQARDANAQNGQWQCPVHGCDTTFTRKAGLLLHMERPNGHKEDLLRDTGNGTFTKIDQTGDMRQGHNQPEDAPQAYEGQTIQDKNSKSKSASEGEYIDDENVWLNAINGEETYGHQLREAPVSDGEEVPLYQRAESLVNDGQDVPQCQTKELKFEEWEIREEFDNEFQSDIDWVLSIAEGKYDLQRK